VAGPLVGLQIPLIAPNSYPVDQLDGSDDITDITLEFANVNPTIQIKGAR
jgi:hypothetical protein